MKELTPNEIRTRVAPVKGVCPRPLDDGGKNRERIYHIRGFNCVEIFIIFLKLFTKLN